MFGQLSKGLCNALGSARLLRVGGRMTSVCVAVGTLAACAQTSKDMYDWQTYQPSVYTYLNDADMDYARQAHGMEQNVETARSSNTVFPPGFRAHLGLLYLKLGKDSKAVEQMEGEKLAFPESTPFMNFLMRNASPTPASQQTPETTSNDSSQRADTAASATPTNAGA